MIPEIPSKNGPRNWFFKKYTIPGIQWISKKDSRKTVPGIDSNNLFYHFRNGL